MGSSTAGGAAWYRYQALSADERVKDAAVSSPEPGQVSIAILSKEGAQAEVATGENLDQLGVAYGITRNPGEADASYRERILAEVQALASPARSWWPLWTPASRPMMCAY